jgi:hypothetical protein
MTEMPGLSPQRRRTVLLSLAMIAALAGCNQNRVFSVRDLTNIAPKYRGRVVTVQGCYRNGIETTVLQPCVNPKPNEIVPVQFRSLLENIRNYVPGYATGPSEYERPSAEERHLEAELSALPNGVQAEVVLRGEYTPVATEHTPSGHQEAEFVVHRVLRVAGHQVR